MMYHFPKRLPAVEIFMSSGIGGEEERTHFHPSLRSINSSTHTSHSVFHSISDLPELRSMMRTSSIEARILREARCIEVDMEGRV